MIWSNKMLLSTLAFTVLVASSCNKKKAGDDSADVGGVEGPTLVVSGTQTVSGGEGGGITVNKTDDGIVFSGNDSADTTPPTLGSNGAISVNGYTPNTISISWTAATDNSGSVIYDIFSSTTQSFDALADTKRAGVTAVKTGHTTTNYTLQNLTDGTSYHIAVVAKDALGNATMYTQVTQTAEIQFTISAATSVVSVVGGGSTLASGASAVLHLRARDPNSNDLAVGGEAVQFTISGGSSTFTQSIPVTAIDNADGTYTATVTGLAAGSAVTIGATVNGTATTSTANLQVVAGAIAPATSVVSIVTGATTVASGGSVVVKLQAKDVAGNSLTSGGAAITFTQAGGSSTFSQSFPVSATDNGNGTYVATLTGVTAGTARTIGAKVGATSTTSTTTLQVVPGVISATTSLVDIVQGTSTVGNAQNVTLRLRARDAANNFLTTGGSAIAFTKSGGTSTFVQSFALGATDNGDGSYTATVTGNIAGTAATIGATIGVTPVSSTVSLGVSSGTISENTSTVSIVGGATTVASGTNVTVRLQAKDASGNNLTAGGSSITFTQTGGTSTFSQSFPVTATDVGNGTYTATLTGVTAGTAKTLGAKIGATTVTSTTTLAVVPGAISATDSIVSIVSSATSVASGSSETIRLQAKDDEGNNLTSGGATVTFTQGASGGTFTQSFPVTATDNGDGTYTATITGNVVGAARTLGATIGGSAVTSATSLSVTPGAISATTSTVSVDGGASTVTSGSGVTLRVQGKDAAGNNVSTGGASVAFTISGGTSTFTQSFPLASTDVGNGTYTATFTGLLVGTAQTVRATIDATTTTLSTTLGVTPGTINTGTSTVSIVGGATTVASGTNVTVRLQAKDAAGNDLTTGGATVAFTKTGGASTFTQSFALAATDVGNGTYTATLTGSVSGSATTLGATIGGSGVTDTAGMQVLPGSIATATSVVSAGASTVASGSSVQVKLDARDAANNVITSGGATVEFTVSGGGSSTFTGSFPRAATDNGDGTYTANLTGSAAGTDRTIGATIDGSAATSTTLLGVNSNVGASLSNQPTGTNNVTTLNVTVAGTGVAYYKSKVGATASIDCPNATGYSAEIAQGTPITTNITGVPDGSVTLCVIGADAAHNYQDTAAATTATWTKKATPPSFTSLDLINEAADGYINAAEKLLTNALGGNLNGAAYTAATYKLVSSGTTCDVNLTYGAMPNDNSGDFGSDGTYKICVKLVDTAGNAPAYGASGTITLKTSTISFSTLPLANDAVGGYLNSTEHALSNALVGAATGSNFNTAAYKLVTSGTTCNNSLTYGAIPNNDSGDFTADGVYKVCAKLTDNAGNPEAYGESGTITLKTSQPDFTGVSLANDAVDTYINAVEKTQNNALVGAASGSNFNTAGYKLVTSGTTCDVGLTYGAIPTGTSGDFGANGSYKVCVKLTDNAGNAPDYGESSAVTLKTTLPTFASLNRGTDAADGYINLAERSLTNALATGISGSNYDTVAYKLTTNATACSGLSYGAMPNDNTSDFGSDGSYKVCARLTDNAGNTADFGSTAAFTLKTAVPTFASLSLINDAANGYINLAERSLTAALAGSISGSNYDTVDYALVASATACSGASFGAMPADNSGAFGADGTYKVCARLQDNAGNPNDYGSSSALTLDTGVPTVSFSSAATNPTNANPIAVTVTFNEAVTGFVSGDVTPGNATLSGFAGSGASYSFNLAPTAAAVTANIAGSVAIDAAGNPNSAAIQFSRTYDSAAPTISSVTSPNSDGTYGAATNISITITFNEAATVTGTPLLTLNTTPSRTASYTSGSGSTVLTFTYATTAGDLSTDLDYAATSSLALNGGTIRDSAGNNATLTLPTVGGGSSLGGTKDIRIDTTAATIVSVDSTLTGPQNDTVNIPVQLNFDDVVTVNTSGGNPTITLNTSPARSATYASGSGSQVLVFTYDVQPGDTVGVLDYVSISSLTIPGSSWIRDSASADVVETLPAVGGGSSLEQSDVGVDTTVPTVTGIDSTTPDATYSVGFQVDIQVSFSEIVVVTGSPRIQLNVTNSGPTTRYATYSSGSGTGTLTFSYIVQGPNSASGDASAELDYSSTSALTLNGGTLNDTAGNAATLTLGAGGSLAANSTIVIDASQPPALGISGVTCCALPANRSAAANEITVQYPANVAAYANVNVYRVLGSTAPSADCATGTLVKNYPSGFSPGATQTFTDKTSNPGKTYSYRVCAMDSGSGIIGTATATSITSSVMQWIFTTKNAVASGNLGGRSGANATCQTAGDTIDSSLTWLALLSDTATEMRGTPIAGTVYNRNSTPAAVASTYSTFYAATATTRQYAQDSTAQSGNAWTGSTTGGLRASTANRCQNGGVDWTNGSSGNGVPGVVTSTSTSWMATTTAACTTSTSRLLCISKVMEPLTSFSTATPASGSGGEIDVTIDFPADTTNWTKVEVRRSNATNPPTWNSTNLNFASPSCTGGDLAKTYNGPTFTDETFSDPTGAPGGLFMYTVCVYNSTNVAASYTNIVKPTRAYTATDAYIIFLTSTTSNGGFGAFAGATGIARADAMCQSRGDTFITGKTWKAILSSSSVMANSRVSAAGDVRNVLGTLIGTSYADLFDSVLGGPISYNDLLAASTSTQIWTGSNAAGNNDGTNHCSDWTLTSGGAGRRGVANSSTQTWIYNSSSSSACNSTRRIWCITATPD